MVDILKCLDVVTSKYPCNLEDRFIPHVRSVLTPLSDDLIVYVLLKLDKLSLVCLLFSYAPKRHSILVKEFTQGKRSEIAPSCNEIGFMCHHRKTVKVIYGNCIATFYSPQGRSSTLVIMHDYEGLLKLVLLLSKRGLWHGGSRTVDQWRKRLIDSL